MKIKRYLAPDMRRAMRQVREKQGPDAVILSSKRLENGVEVIAAIDYDAELYSSTTQQKTVARDRGERLSEAYSPPQPEPVGGDTIAFGKAAQAWSNEPTMISMKQEVASLRKLLESQLASLAWSDNVRRHPVRATVTQELIGLGLSSELASALADEAGDDNIESATENALRLIEGRIQILDREIFDEPGAVAIVGPTGVGKTTTIAKLAARYVLKHGAESLALLTTDSFRIGAQEQLLTFGRILGVPVQLVRDGTELANAISLMEEKKLILIDSAGMSQRDQHINRELAAIDQNGTKIRVLLALSGNAQTAVLEETVQAFKHLNPIGCVLTKADESTSLGGLISVLLRHQLPLAYITDGQKVPEDLHWAGGKRFNLTQRALELKGSDAPQILEEEMAHA